MGTFVILALSFCPFVLIPTLFSGELTFDELVTYFEGLLFTSKFWVDILKLVIESIFA